MKRIPYISAAELFPERVDTIKNVVLSLLTTFSHFRIFAFSFFEKLGKDFKKICSDCLLFQRKSVFLYRLHAESGSKTAGKSPKKEF